MLTLYSVKHPGITSQYFLCRSALETDLKIEREWRGTLQRSLEQEKQKVAQLQAEIQHAKELRRVSTCSNIYCLSSPY